MSNKLGFWGKQEVVGKSLSNINPYYLQCLSDVKAILVPISEKRVSSLLLNHAQQIQYLSYIVRVPVFSDRNEPTLSFRGLENPAYYILEANKANYANYSGCGNTFNGNHSVVRHLILDCLRYWVSQMHVDGFRFDLASVLSRDESGKPLENPPILWSIESDPVLAGTKIIAEAWDAGGLYQVGTFIGDRFCQWNGPFRDNVRRFVKGDSGTVRTLAARIMGSPDIYPQSDRDPNRSINFVTCHDGFTLNDLVSYNDKHNEANGEDNRDGANDNYSWNCGEEGKTDDLAIEALRQRQIKNFLTILFLAQGTPMLLMGDEVRRSQQGNKNAYCQDNELSWFDGRNLDKYADLRHFTQCLIDFTQSRAIFRLERFMTTTTTSKAPQIIWHGTRLGQPDWGYDCHSLAFSLHHPECNEHLHVMLNAKIAIAYLRFTTPATTRELLASNCRYGIAHI